MRSDGNDRPSGVVRLGVSACLLGHQVRFDGQHKRNAFLVDELGPLVELVPVCPEVELGMGVPRPTLHLVRRAPGAPAASARLVVASSGEDWTERMQAYARARVRELAQADLSGYVLKKDSPSCGLDRVNVHDPSERDCTIRDGRGLFAAELRRVLPDLPIEEEGRLEDPRVRDDFVERLFAYRRRERV